MLSSEKKKSSHKKKFKARYTHMHKRLSTENWLPVLTAFFVPQTEQALQRGYSGVLQLQPYEAKRLHVLKLLLLHIKAIWLLLALHSFMFTLKPPYGGIRGALTSLIKRWWSGLCWYIKQEEKEGSRQFLKEVRHGHFVLLLGLIFALLHLAFFLFP